MPTRDRHWTSAPYLHIELQGSDAWKITCIHEWANLYRFG